MLRWLDQLTNKKSDDYFKLGGPRSFHKFKYNNCNIILIGEVHEKIPSILVDQYRNVLNIFLEKNNHLKLYIENETNSLHLPSKDNLSFIDLMSEIQPTNTVQIIHADQRKFEPGFLDFFCF